ncbi:hypothetical protein [Streptomyces sp. CRN 30]|uniref:hypothetical protein n=1 Tax=Streptomyces sp. CRN 30 TaxID=3075613 RepID=UPI002A834906|nr:hypothetical protein [Streptomyces sp. CRN 30]
MPTPRHHINQQRRRQARGTRPPAPGTGSAVLTAHGAPDTYDTQIAHGTQGAHDTHDGTDRQTAGDTERAGRARFRLGGGARRPRRPRHRTGILALCLLTLALGGFAGWAHARAEGLRDDPALRNSALTDLARTSELKGRTDRAVATLFSYDHTEPEAFERAAKDLLTEKAVGRHRTLFADVRARAEEQKAVITTTVTESAVERIDGDRARVLVYADQSSVATAGTEGGADQEEGTGQNRSEGAYAGAMLAVDLVHRDGRWLVSGIDTFGR